MKSQLSRLTVGLLIAIGSGVQASPSFAKTGTNTVPSTYCSNTLSYQPQANNFGFFPQYICQTKTLPKKTFTTPKGELVYTYDTSINKLTYSIGNANSPFHSSGVFQYNLKTFKGTNYGTFKEENGATGMYLENFPLADHKSVAKPDYLRLNINIPSIYCNNTLTYQSQAQHFGFFPQSVCQTNTLLTRKFTTPKGDGVYTYDPTTNKLIYSIGNANSPFQSSGVFQYNLKTLWGTNYGTFKEENGATGMYSETFPLNNSQSVPEPDSLLLNMLSFGGVLGAGLMLKRQHKKT